VLAADISHELAGKLLNADSWTKSNRLIDLPAGASHWKFDFESLYLEAGRYMIDLWLADPRHFAYDHRPMSVQINVLTAEGLPADNTKPPQEHGLVPCSFTLSQVNQADDARRTS
jgi:hypothetical protein